ncbi:hypothetical protein JTB14_008227 [Gonioctena quinquepunctata]|nr:hypothetical protein JTB14_008227 [Gonioctena quinquepunctata]
MEVKHQDMIQRLIRVVNQRNHLERQLTRLSNRQMTVKHQEEAPSETYECPKCLKFNVKIAKCDLPENVPECTIHDKVYQQYQKYNLFKPAKICTGPGVFPDPSNEQRYYECIEILDDNMFYLTSKKCPSKQKFNPKIRKCDPKYIHPHHQNRNLVGDCKSHYTFHKYSCQKFFRCSRKHNPVELKCPDGYIFNGDNCQLISSKSFCNWEILNGYLNTKKHLSNI